MLFALAAAAMVIPQEYQGMWGATIAACRRAPAAGPADDIVAVGPTRIDFFASSVTLIEGSARHGRFAFSARAEEEGEISTARIVLRRNGTRLRIMLDDEQYAFVRCPPRPRRR